MTRENVEKIFVLLKTTSLEWFSKGNHAIAWVLVSVGFLVGLKHGE